MLSLIFAGSARASTAEAGVLLEHHLVEQAAQPRLQHLEDLLGEPLRVEAGEKLRQANQAPRPAREKRRASRAIAAGSCWRDRFRRASKNAIAPATAAASGTLA